MTFVDVSYTLYNIIIYIITIMNIIIKVAMITVMRYNNIVTKKP